MKEFKVCLFSLLLGMLGLLHSTFAAAQAVTDTTNVSIPTDLAVFIPCANNGAGEDVQLSGPLHMLFHVTISAGDKIIIKSHFQPQGISGVGRTTGDKYRATGVTQETTTFDSIDGFPFVTSFVNNFKIIGRGPGNNFLVHENFHVTINANGEVTVFVDNFKFDCK
jgi:hypothetical protein